jgi:hypothetical protein
MRAESGNTKRLHDERAERYTIESEKWLSGIWNVLLI